ncbi:hypothetical protein T440DRAFT_168748 [Plenodomus tracheiphilus IPT5]|uniref:Uncharacterized protein n=1 Tax=Plenodomus tracheiphilus IPT5 TaxID=1408161 RepID=A0A6A7B2L4_9PLEO|nr:hypothetical protein T440DRAFT_168748 [Plenodomus tracheiphilus IPT5]
MIVSMRLTNYETLAIVWIDLRPLYLFLRCRLRACIAGKSLAISVDRELETPVQRV